MRTYAVGVLGATGAVGRQMIEVLEERGFPLAELRLLASAKSAGQSIAFRGEKVAVRAVGPGCFAGLDIVLGAVSAGLARQYASEITAAGAVFIDNSSAFRMRDDVPLVIPEINPGAARGSIIANPNCSTIITLVAIWPIAQQFGLKSITASTYQAVSGAGVAGPAQLEAELGGQVCQSPAFRHPIARNIIPAIGGIDEDGYTQEEVKMLREGRKIMGLPGLKVACTCVRVPVARCHCISASIETVHPVTPAQARQAIEAGDGVALMDDLDAGSYPMPINTEGRDTVFVGRIRPDMTRQNGLALWCCGDQVRKGAATNAVQIAELLI